MAERLVVSVEPGDVTVLRCAGEIDISTGPILEDGLRQAYAAGGDLVLDMSAVSFMDSTGLGLFVTAAKACTGAGTRIGIAGAAPIVVKVLTVTGLIKMLPVWDSVEDAEHALQADSDRGQASPTAQTP